VVIDRDDRSYPYFFVSRNFWTLFSFQSLMAFAVDLLGGGIRIEQKELSEEELAQRMSNGDDHAFEVLYERYFDQIFGFVKRRVDSYERAEDLVSTVFMKVFSSRTRFSRGSFKAWIFRIANNTLIDDYRTYKPTRQLDLERHDVAATQTAASDILDQQSLRHTLERAMAHLDPRSQQVIQLKFFAELSNEEIALSMKITTNHVGVLLFRALKKCADFLPNTGQPEA